MTEAPLPGGTANRGLVVRVGGTVRRPQTAGSAGVHALLVHLERVGFDGAPRYLGQDERGREVLTYVPGEVPTAPHPAWALGDDALVSVAGLLRRYHEAVAGFDPRPHTWSSQVPPGYGGGLVSHNDPNLDNVVFRDGRAAALIDFDLASPGSALWDVALAARLWVPLRDPRDVDPSLRGRAAERLVAFLDAYGLHGPDRRRVVDAAARTHDWCYAIVREGARRGQSGYPQYWASSAPHAERARRWLAAGRRDLQDAVGGPV